ncbi:ribonuclease domain-containing protein [Amycolatopsis jiangsuensis]|uniref:Guanyl-specific ribonuclease Sa n=1 Tax=Amycolatopsis jiangsuensis TaxID=1181879 RepID=A0A840IKQ7_9PSEU|nr:ribonuclease domain-containing protein [Amycolatopsis jiangsuensis]MBB4682533.1 guanyl-specific ribonuclease Sa [Amycolatopsis jiangsuensis]
MVNRRRITAALVGLLVLVLGGWLVKEGTGGPDTPSGNAPAAASAGQVPGAAASGLPLKPLSALPSQAGDTWRLIRRGGPYPYPHNDDVVFQNRENVLPSEKSGYYHEYTVKTPGSPDRGPRRLVTGAAQELYYTGDHYTSFVVVDPNR